MLNTASSTFSRMAWLRMVASGAVTVRFAERLRRHRRRHADAASTVAATIAITRLLAGPAAATST